jgi:hypothetical protein
MQQKLNCHWPRAGILFSLDSDQVHRRLAVNAVPARVELHVDLVTLRLHPHDGRRCTSRRHQSATSKDPSVRSFGEDHTTVVQLWGECLRCGGLDQFGYSNG